MSTKDSKETTVASVAKADLEEEANFEITAATALQMATTATMVLQTTATASRPNSIQMEHVTSTGNSETNQLVVFQAALVILPSKNNST